MPNGTGPFVEQNTTFGTENFTTGTNINTPQDVAIQIFPSPTNGILNINFEDNYTQEKEIRLIDLFGKTLFIKKITANEFQIDVSNFASGIYVLEIHSGEFYFSKKIIIQK